MSDMQCNVCRQMLGGALYSSPSGQSLTSLCQIYPGTTSVYACHACAHLQSNEIKDVDAYYEQDYDILVGSEDEDQIYEIRDGNPIYRTEHQVSVLLSKISLPTGARILDYGCAKSSTMRVLSLQRPDIQPHLFDVSKRYIPFWEKFAQPGNWTVYEPKADWDAHFDVVTSLFSLEHIVRPAETMGRIAALLKPGGLFYCVVPNVLTNIADFLVADHVNHFTQSSVMRLMELAGMQLREVDHSAHRGALVIVSERPAAGVKARENPLSADVGGTLSELARIAAFWNAAAQRVQSFEAGLGDASISVYGAGFYGSFIAASLNRPDRIICFVDQNPYLQGKQMNGKSVVAPHALPSTVDAMLVGLNPAHARSIIESIPELAARPLRYFYL